MNTFTYDFVHLALLALGGKVEGKTKFQKLVYFLGVLTGHAEDLGYRPQYYGPYSADVSDSLDLLAARQFVSLSHAGIGNVDTRGFELVRTDYVLTTDGKKIAEAKANAHPEWMVQLQQAAKVLEGVKSRDYMKLSIAAKTYFMLKADPRANLPSLAKKFGWEVTELQIEEAKGLLGSLKLDPSAT